MTGAPVSFGSGTRHVLPCRPGEAIRLHHLGAVLPPSHSPLAAGTGDEALRAALKRLCPPWDLFLPELIDRYFTFLRRGIERARPRIEKRLSPYEGLYAAGDVLFSAPAPLPHARIDLPGLRDEPLPALIWTGKSFTALLDGGAGETPRRLRERAAKLEAAGVAIRTVPADAHDDFLDALPGMPLERFLETDPLPCAPLPPDLMPEFLLLRNAPAATQENAACRSN